MGRKQISITELDTYTPAISPIEAMRRQLALAVYGAVSENDVVSMVNKLKEQALSGDLKAMKLFFSLLVGNSAGQPVNVQQAVVVQQEDRQPAKPTVELPRTPAKIEVMAERARNGEVLFHHQDATHGNGDE